MHVLGLVLRPSTHRISVHASRARAHIYCNVWIFCIWFSIRQCCGTRSASDWYTSPSLYIVRFAFWRRARSHTHTHKLRHMHQESHEVLNNFAFQLVSYWIAQIVWRLVMYTTQSMCNWSEANECTNKDMTRCTLSTKHKCKQFSVARQRESRFASI